MACGSSTRWFVALMARMLWVYRNGNCVSSERVCSTILNMPCVLPDGWNKRAVSVFHDILSGSK